LTLPRGESYAGSLPISSNANDTNKLFFWFFPSENQTVGNEITIWLTGGVRPDYSLAQRHLIVKLTLMQPGCSSIGELLSENGPVLWQPGVFKPIRNKWSWHKLTNMVWIDQPVGAGFSQGNVTARNEFDVAKQFMGFWKNFVDTFALNSSKVYITGSSYSGMYCPYIASAMLDANDTQYFDVRGMQVFDGLYSNDPIAQDIPVSSFATAWSDVFGFNDSFVASMQNRSKSCGYDDYLKKYIVYPATERQPSAVPGFQSDQVTPTEGCGLFNDVYTAASQINPCFSIYTITSLCPVKYDPLGFSDNTNYRPEGSGPAYFNRPDVKAVIHAPDKEWTFCTNDPVFVNGTDNSVVDGPGSQPVIPNVIDRTQNVILGHGSQDFVLISDGTLLSIQNMTWGGKLGFQTRPTEPLYMPYHDNDNFETLAGAGIVGTAHKERGLTYIAVGPAGHFLAMDAPQVAFRSMEVLLGRVEGFQSMAPFTIDTNNTVQPNVQMGNGTVHIQQGGVVSGGSGNAASGGSVARSAGCQVGSINQLGWIVLSVCFWLAVY
jgi:carboxypeptidase D